VRARGELVVSVGRGAVSVDLGGPLALRHLESLLGGSLAGRHGALNVPVLCLALRPGLHDQTRQYQVSPQWS
jgi:hypothetical protein